jgi:NADH-quinone oxidoreductase subunit M
LAIIAAAGVILTAGYILWTMQRVYLGPEYKGPHPEAITPFTGREKAVAYTLVVFAVLLGVFPNLLFSLMNGSIDSLVNSMAHTYDTMHGAGAAMQTTLLP